MEKFLADVAVGILISAVIWYLKVQWPLIRGLLDAESRRQAAQIKGRWNVTEKFADGTSSLSVMVVKCTGGQVSGTQFCREGFDEGEDYHLRAVTKIRC